MEFWILVLLILGSGVLAMAEMAVGASRISHLAMRAEQGSVAALAVLGFRQHASRLLATTQLGITALAMLSGVYGEALWVPRLQAWLLSFTALSESIGYGIALSAVVIVITFFSIVFCRDKFSDKPLSGIQDVFISRCRFYFVEQPYGFLFEQEAGIRVSFLFPFFHGKTWEQAAVVICIPEILPGGFGHQEIAASPG